MKILLIATPEAKGHHKLYFEIIADYFASRKNFEVVSVTQTHHSIENVKQYYIENVSMGTRRFIEYLRYVNQLKNIVIKESPDVVHIQCGDNFYRFFAFGLSFLKDKKVFFTFHHDKKSIIRDISLLRFASLTNLSNGGVIVHSQQLKERMLKSGFKRCTFLDYPDFIRLNNLDAKASKSYFGINDNIKVISYIGGTGYIKGLDILLRALKTISKPFHLLIAGAEIDFKYDYIEKETTLYKNSCHIFLRYLSDEELNMAFCASDYVVLPYRNVFEGASGMLTSSVILRKCVVASNRGSLGETVTNNSLGYVFEPDNSENLSYVITQALVDNFEWTEKAEAYRDKLNIDYFCNEVSKLFKS